MQITFAGCGDAFGSGGRFNTCFHVDGCAAPFLIDCGATSLVALKRAGLDPGQIATIFVSHFHADHFMGIPFLVLDGQFGNRTAPLTIVGPKGLAAQYERAMETAFPGSSRAARDFEVKLEEIAPGAPREADGLRVTATEVRHAKSMTCLGYRFDVDRKVLAYTGDTEWIPALIDLGRDADLLVSEACFWDRNVPGHMNVTTLRENLPEVGAKRVVLTHMGEEVLSRLDQIGFETAADGLTITL
ncbi:MBL fold metallo-hydrolase [uncultured Paracoccus sp.]|uniref:MBL fold metallo-hydrolase n=1 Tax=uncultured Paracoccus sp. TaxID=189685 RepID=UPI002626E0E5|nr:MBL fold metallo-hydrolase [uncultured Paracoccus sp.]